jgi:hypothetical protein
MPSATESVRINAGMDLPSRLLWHVAWNPRIIYVIGGLIALCGATALRSPYGLLFGLTALLVRWKATQLVNEKSAAVIDVARTTVSSAGAKRVGVELADVDCTPLLVGAASRAPFGIRLGPQYAISAVYLSDPFFATYSGASFSLPTRTLQLGTTAEEVYFRHVSAVNQRDGYIEITLTRGNKSKRIETGNDPNGARLLDAFRTRLRAPAIPQAAPSPIVNEQAPPEPQAPLTISNSDDERYCYIRPSKLTEYYSDPIVLSTLMEQLQVPGTVATHNLMNDREKKAAIEGQIGHFSQTPTSFWYRVPPREILAASIWRMRGDLLSQKVISDKFYDVAREEDLRRPVARWLQTRGDEPYMEIQLGRRRIDVLGYSKNGPHLTAVELKNSDEEFRRGPDQMGSFAEYAHAVYLACTPAFAADYLERNAEHRAVNHWDPTLLDRKLRQGGFGLLIVERDTVFEVIKPVEQTPSPVRVVKIIVGLPAFHKIDLD